MARSPFYGGGTEQLPAQLIGNAVIGCGVFIVSVIMVYLVKATGTPGVSKEIEQEGLDLPEHGTTADPELRG